VRGVYGDAEFQRVIRALDGMKGVDLMSAPTVTTKVGQMAVINVIREFRYPAEFDPPKTKFTTGGLAGSGQRGGPRLRRPASRQRTWE